MPIWSAGYPDGSNSSRREAGKPSILLVPGLLLDTKKSASSGGMRRQRIAANNKGETMMNPYNISKLLI